MVKRKYTELEIELYECLAKIEIIKRNMIETFKDNVYNYARQNKEKLNKWVRNILDNLVNLDNILEKAKVPTKFAITNSLGGKNERR